MASKTENAEQESVGDSDMEEFEDALEDINVVTDIRKGQANEEYGDDYMTSDEDVPDMGKIMEENSDLVNSNMGKMTLSENSTSESKITDKEIDGEHHHSEGPASENITVSNDNTELEDVKETTDDSDLDEAEEPQEDIDVRKEREDKMTEEEREANKSEAQVLKTKGNALFKEKKFEDALISYTDGLHICPLCYARDRSLLYSNRAACKMHLERYESAIEDSSKAMELNPQYLKALLRRAELYEKVDKLDEALADYQRVLEMDPSQHSARQACMRLPDQIKERNEKLKEEMIGKLKDLGNMVLKPFGLSTENFKLQQDPNTGSYSVNFQQSPKS